ncbi:PQQ-dependent sugar dehydrogenase [Rubrivivax rivuli]|nr:PQQ-dependent sugar dehydrogenase [Rubrivivax rivuli]
MLKSLKPRRLAAALALAPLAATLLAVTTPAAWAQAPTLTVTPVMEKLRGPWDLAFAPGGAMLYTEKCHGLWVRLPDGSTRHLWGTEGAALAAPDIFCQGQSGVHGVAVDPAFAQGQRFVYVFTASNLQTDPRINRVVRLQVAADWKTVGQRTDIVPDIAFKDARRVGGPGAHSGGRIRFGPDGYLWITTGDNHDPGLPQDPKRLGGKVLRVDRDGKAAPGNGAPAGFDARIYTYGHRNVQGIAFRPAGQPNAGQAYTSEHGPNHSDELTALVAGGNAGWDPQNRPDLKCSDGYCGYSGNPFTMPMTDTQRFPKAMLPAWNNEQRSQGMGPLAFLEGAQWKGWNGKLAVALMRDQRLDIVTLDGPGKAASVETADLPKLRLRSIVPGPDGALWGSTDDGQILKISPK